MKNVVTAAIIKLDPETGKYVILLEKHVKCKGLYVMPCGKVDETDKDFPSALKRELNEELGIPYEVLNKITPLHISSTITTYDRIDGIHTFHEHVFDLSFKDFNIINKEPEKHSEIIYVPINDVIEYCESELDENGAGELKLDKYSYLTYQVCKNFSQTILTSNFDFVVNNN